MIRPEKSWDEYVENLRRCAAKAGWELEEPSFSACCGGGELSTKVTKGSRKVDISGYDIDELEEALITLIEGDAS